MEYKYLLFDLSDSVAVITINRTDKLNALNIEMLAELRELFTKIKTNDSVNVVIVTGAGEKAFVAGADIAEINQLDSNTGKNFAENGQEVFNLIENLGKPVIAVVNGFALGGGCELAMACHIRLASEKAKFGQPEVNLGIIPGYGGTQRLTKLINSGRALEYILTGHLIDSTEAFNLGLVNRVYPPEELLPMAKELAIKISSKSQVAVKMVLQAVAAAELPKEEGLKIEASLFAACCGTEDFKEGTTAFIEKRKPQFKNK
ncbi:MAG: enoyl-CoA hydratase-related protein [bacterium]